MKKLDLSPEEREIYLKNRAAAARARRRADPAYIEREKQKQAAAYRSDKERFRDYSRRWREKYPERSAAIQFRKHIWRMYRLTVEQYLDMATAQGWRCKICRKHQSEQSRRMCVDHCHATGKVRGLLCRECNSSIGQFRESPEALRRAARYIEEHQNG